MHVQGWLYSEILYSKTLNAFKFWSNIIELNSVTLSNFFVNSLDPTLEPDQNKQRLTIHIELAMVFTISKVDGI